MYLVAIAWFYVALMMALAEAMHPQGTVLGAVFTLLLYGIGPLSVVLYIMGTPLRRKAKLAGEAAEAAAEAERCQSTTTDTVPLPMPVNAVSKD